MLHVVGGLRLSEPLLRGPLGTSPFQVSHVIELQYTAVHSLVCQSLERLVHHEINLKRDMLYAKNHTRN